MEQGGRPAGQRAASGVSGQQLPVRDQQVAAQIQNFRGKAAQVSFYFLDSDDLWPAI